jgi:hypothetical protein
VTSLASTFQNHKVKTALVCSEKTQIAALFNWN